MDTYLPLLLAASLSCGSVSADECSVKLTCTVALTDQLPFTPPEPGVWLAYEYQGNCGLHWAGDWNVVGAANWYVYRRPWNAMCGPECQEIPRRGQYLHIPNDNPPGTYKVELTSESGGGYVTQCFEVLGK